MDVNASEEPASNFFHVNAHRVRIEPPDIVRIWWNGHCTRSDFAGVIDLSRRHMGDRRFFVLADISNLKSIDPDARKLAASDPLIQDVIRIALIGATFHMRVIMMLLARASELFNRGQREKAHFFDTESEALVWIAEERERLGSAARLENQDA